MRFIILAMIASVLSIVAIKYASRSIGGTVPLYDGQLDGTRS